MMSFKEPIYKCYRCYKYKHIYKMWRVDMESKIALCDKCHDKGTFISHGSIRGSK